MSSGNFRPTAPLVAVKRNDQSYYPYKLILETLFPRVPAPTVRRWLRECGKSTIRTNSSERRLLVKQGQLAHRFLVSENDLRELVEHSKTRRSFNKHILESPLHVENAAEIQSRESLLATQRSSSSDIVISSSFNVSSNVVSSLPPLSNEIVSQTPTQEDFCLDRTLEDVCSDQIISQMTTSHEVSSVECQSLDLPSCSEIVSILASSSDPASVGDQMQTHEGCSEIYFSFAPFSNQIDVNSQTRTEEDPFSVNQIEPSQTRTREVSSEEIISQATTHEISNVECQSLDLRPLPSALGKIGCLRKEDVGARLQNDLDKLRDFYTSKLNPLRTCSSFSASTMKKFMERVSCFLNYCRVKYPERTLDFTFVDDADIVQTYTTYQLEERKLSIATVIRTVSALINLAKYVHRDSQDLDSCVELVHLRNVQRQLSESQSIYQFAVKAGLCADKESSSVFMFSHLLETIKSLKEKVDSLRGSPGHTRILHDFVLLSLYVTSMCGRSKEIRTLELFHEREEGKNFVFNWERRCNVFVVSANEEKFTLYENDFKNLRNHGPSKLEIQNSLWLVPYLKEFIKKRKELLFGKVHPFMFVSATGLAFTSSSFTVYLGNLFEREVNVRAGTTKLRHALVTHVLSLPESESLRLRESLAVLMRHSRKHQETTYCDISRQERTSLSRDLVNKSVQEAALNTETNSTSSVMSSFHAQNRPVEAQSCEIAVGDMVALLDSVSTCPQDATIFLGRVLKIRDNEALLMEFRREPDSETPLYRGVVESSWWEELDSLIYPVDVVFDSGRQAYELRSTAEEIYDVVYPRNSS